MNIKIGKAARSCTECAEAFNHDQELFSVIRVEEDAFVRADYCTDCWSSDRASETYSHWSPRFYDPSVAEQAPPESFSPLRKIFYDSVESTARNTLSVAYLAAQLLRRQKVFRLLKEIDGEEAESNVILFSDRIGNRLIEVQDPSLTFAELEEGRVMLMRLLAQAEDPDKSSGDDSPQPDSEKIDDASDEKEEE